MKRKRVCEVRRLGIMEYAQGLKLQEALTQARKAGAAPDTLLLLEHPHVITLGRNANRNNVLLDSFSFAEREIELFHIGRGGDVTYHGPGQIVGYPILDLRPDRCDIHRYVRDIEEVMIRACRDYSIKAERISGLTGVWVGDEKIGAIGVRISHWITSHGFAFNVNTDLGYFSSIIPCGIADHGVTSLERLLGRKLELRQVEDRLIYHFADIFEREIVEKPHERHSIQAIVFCREDERIHYLLLQRIQDRGGFWQPVTGRVEPGEEFARAARREVREETQLDLAPIDLNFSHSFVVDPQLWREPDSGDVVRVNREIAFAAQAPTKDVVIDGAEHQGFEWVDYSEAMRRLVWFGNKTALKLTQQLLPNQASTIEMRI